MPNPAPKLRQRLAAIRNRHKTLDMRIRDELRRPGPDGLRLQTLKRLRLKAKDQIAMLSASMNSRGSGGPEAA